MVTPGRGELRLPERSKRASLKRKPFHRSVWSSRCGEPVPLATPGIDTWPLWPGGRTDSACRTRACAGAATAADATNSATQVSVALTPGATLPSDGP